MSIGRHFSSLITFSTWFILQLRSLLFIRGGYAVGSLCDMLPATASAEAQCASLLTPGLVLYILRAQLSLRVSLARCHWCGPVLQVEPLAPAICYPRRRLSPHPDAPNLGVMAFQFKKRTQANPLVPAREFNLIACRNLTRHAGSSGS